MLLKWKVSAKTGEGIYILQSMILYRKVVLKVVLNRIINLPDTRYPAGYPVDPDIRYSPTVKCRGHGVPKIMTPAMRTTAVLLVF